jgi:predicted nucleotidyltransferase
MDTQTLHHHLTQFKQQLIPQLHDVQLVLFGSQAAGTAAPDSDIDVIIVSSFFQNVAEDKRLDLLYKTSAKSEVEIQPWGVTPQELAAADIQSTLGQARDRGVFFA